MNAWIGAPGLLLVREYFGERIMGTALGAVSLVATLGMALGPLIGSYLYDAVGSYARMFIGSSAIGLGTVAIAFTFRPPQALGAPPLAPRASASRHETSNDLSFNRP